MKSLTKTIICALACGFASLLSAQTAPSLVLLAYFNFNNTDPNPVVSGQSASFATTGAAEVYNTTDKTISIASAGEMADSAMLDMSSFVAPRANPVAYFGTTVNAYDGAASGGALQLVSTVFNTSYIDLSLSTIGFGDMTLSFASASNATGATGVSVSVSADGTDFVLAGTSGTTNTFQTISFDLSAFDQIEDISTAYIRIQYSGITGTGTTRLDNLQISGTAIPEPSVAGMLTGLLALCVVIRRVRK